MNSRPTLISSGTGGPWDAAAGKPRPVDLLREGNTAWGPRFFWEGRRLFQRSALAPDRVWEVPQVVDTVDPRSPRYNARSAYAKTLRRNGSDWGSVPGGVRPPVAAGTNAPAGSTPYWLWEDREPLREDSKTLCAAELAHDNSSVSCQVCHTSWATSCFGCHLPMRANQRVAANKFEGTLTRNYTTYNPQVVRDDVFQLGMDATYKHHRLAVLRSSSAVLVGSQNANREWIYSQQQTISAGGYSGQAYNPHFPHTTSSVGTTKNCTDCHRSTANDNEAWMTSLLGFGTGTVNFFGRYAYVGCGDGGFAAVAWTERDEPQAAYGSHLQSLAYPDDYAVHVNERKGRLTEAYPHHARDIRDLVLRGEYLYTANGADGFEVFDVANVDQKGFSERVVTAPVSPLGQRLWVRTPDATSVILPTTLGVDPLRQPNPPTEDVPGVGTVYSDNEEQPHSLAYGFVYVTDRKEGLVNVLVGTLLDGDPTNNFLDRPEGVFRFNPDGRLDGLEHGYFAGPERLYLVGRQGFFVVNVVDPAHPKFRGVLSDGLNRPRAIAVQGRYAFVSDADGVKVLDVSDADHPRLAARWPLAHAGRLYAARTYLYVPNGPEGLAIVDIQNPEVPRLVEQFTAEGVLNDVRAVQIGSIAASMYALIADGRNGLRVLQIISPDTVPGAAGFSPRPSPRLIATYPTPRPAVAVGRGLDRDRVVDESGRQTVVFGRRGSRPFNEEEFGLLLRHSDPSTGRPTGPEFRVEDIDRRSDLLQTRAGREVKPTLEFVAEPPLPGIPTLPRERLVRRGRSDGTEGGRP